MHAAVDVIERQGRIAVESDWANGMDRNDPHLIVWSLLRYVPGYTLGKPPPGSVTDEQAATLDETYGHPGFGKAMGAWPIYDFPQALAECQAIVRFIRGVLLQTGVPGEAAHVVIYADAAAANGSVALEDSIVPRDSDLQKYAKREDGTYELRPGLASKSRMQNGIMQAQRLADKIVKAPWPGEPVPPPVPYGGTMNTFEACLRFTHGGDTYYYGGGVPRNRRSKAQMVLWAFKQLVWTVFHKDAQGQGWWHVTEIIHPVPPLGADGKPNYFEPGGDINRWPV